MTFDKIFEFTEFCWFEHVEDEQLYFVVDDKIITENGIIYTKEYFERVSDYNCGFYNQGWTTADWNKSKIDFGVAMKLVGKGIKMKNTVTNGIYSISTEGHLLVNEQPVILPLSVAYHGFIPVYE